MNSIDKEEVIRMPQTSGAHEIELERVRLLHETQYLRHFVTRSITWELLLVIYELEGIGEYGINDYIDRLKTMRTTRLTIQNFIKDRIEEGSLIVTKSYKKSRKTLILSDKLKEEIEVYFEWVTGVDVSSIPKIDRDDFVTANVLEAISERRT